VRLTNCRNYVCTLLQQYAYSIRAFVAEELGLWQQHVRCAARDRSLVGTSGIITLDRGSLKAPRSQKIYKPNLQTVHTVVKGTPAKLRVCTKCIKGGKVARA